MLAAALRDGTAHRRTTLRGVRPPAARGPALRRRRRAPARFVEALAQFRFDDAALASLADFLDRDTLAYLADYRFSGDVDGYAEGELYFPGSPVLSVHGTFAECVVLETLALSIFNHDTAIASAAARMVSAAEGRPLIEMGSRRTHEQAAVAAARAAYIAGFAGVVQPRGPAPLRRARAGHQRARVHAAAHHRPTGPTSGRRSRRRSTRSASAPRCSSTPTTSPRAWPTRSRWQAPSSARSASTPATWACWPARSATNSTASAPPRPASWCRATSTSSRSRRCAPNPSTSTASGTSVVTGSGAPTASMVYKLVEVDGIPVEKRSSHKESHGGRKQALRPGQAVGHHRRGGRPSRTAEPPPPTEPAPGPHGRPGPRGRTGRRPRPRRGPRRVKDGLHSLPWDGLKLSKGEPAIPTRMIPGRREDA